MKPLDIRTLPLEGTVCIEASAGTGKTFTIGLIILRLVMEKDLDLQRLAVVTFTEAATGELTQRIAAFLRTACDYAAGGERTKGNEQIADLVDAAKESADDRVLLRIENALLNFDLARISTIHGFCARMLDEFAFETRSSFGMEVVGNQQELIDEILADFWRREIAPLEPRIAKFLGDMTPASLGDYLRSFLAFPGLEVSAPPIDSRSINEFCAAYDRMHERWQTSRGQLSKILTEDPGRFKQTSYKVDSITKYVEQVDDLFAAGKIDEKKMVRFSAASLEANLKKGVKFALSPNPFALQIQEFVERYARVPECVEGSFRTKAFLYLVRELKTRQRARHVRSFNAMIGDLADALNTGGEQTAAVLRQGFSAVLVDEFQDTDPLQYEIFSRLFDGQKEIFFAIIGDPKQAIYRFRGGDIDAYVRARNGVPAESRFTISQNYRSEPRLVDAINRIYGIENPAFGGRGPFLEPEIQYIDVHAKRDLLPPEQGGKPVSPVILWNATVGQSPNEWAIGRRIAGAIAGFMDPHNPLMLGPASNRRPLGLGDIAILVGSHRLAAVLKNALGESGIRSVIGKSGPILASDEAALIVLCLEAALNPSNARTVRALLHSPLYGLDIDALTAWEASDADRLATLEELKSCKDLWMKEGIASALNNFLSRRSVFSLKDNADDELRQERCITNLRHLIEMLHGEELRLGRNPERLLSAFVRMRAESAGSEDEEMQQRLESDYDAVQIITMHKSKGLQWPVVFAVDLYRDGIPSRNAVLPIFSDGKSRKADLDPMKFEEIEKKVHEELRQERMRLAYVTLTRAESLLVAVTANRGSDEDPDLSPAALLLRSPKLGALKDGKGPLVRIEALNPDVPLVRLERRRSLDARRAIVQWDVARKVVPRWTAGSYTGLTRGVVHEWIEAEPDDTPAEGIFAFPRGADAGTALHSVFEKIDFSSIGHAGEVPSEENARLIKGILTDAGLYGDGENEQEGQVMEMVRRVLYAPIPMVGNNFRLAELGPQERLEELEFHLAAAHPEFGKPPVTEEILVQVLGPETGHITKGKQLAGFLSGFMDLVFRHKGKWWILDWKSNHLGNSAERYGREPLERAMKEHNYHLQYHLYTVALARYLKVASGGEFEYERDFGGVLYMFIRGVDGKGSGIYHARPAREVIDRLEAML
jgi:exodeoxyribonuclease V beta subunit